MAGWKEGAPGAPGEISLKAWGKKTPEQKADMIKNDWYWLPADIRKQEAAKRSASLTENDAEKLGNEKQAAIDAANVAKEAALRAAKKAAEPKKSIFSRLMSGDIHSAKNID